MHLQKQWKALYKDRVLHSSEYILAAGIFQDVGMCLFSPSFVLHGMGYCSSYVEKPLSP